MQAGRARDLRRMASQISWCVANAESLPFGNQIVDFVTIAFGLRNITDRQAALREAYRILKPVVGFFVLNFHVENPTLAVL